MSGRGAVFVRRLAAMARPWHAPAGHRLAPMPTAFEHPEDQAQYHSDDSNSDGLHPDRVADLIPQRSDGLQDT